MQNEPFYVNPYEYKEEPCIDIKCRLEVHPSKNILIVGELINMEPKTSVTNGIEYIVRDVVEKMRLDMGKMKIFTHKAFIDDTKPKLYYQVRFRDFDPRYALPKLPVWEKVAGTRKEMEHILHQNSRSPFQY